MLIALTCGWLGGTGCVYYNGIYNAKSAARSADARVARGNEADASALFSQSAASAESTLARHPKSSWRTRALYLAGRGHALSNECDKAEPHLLAFLAVERTSRDDRDRARVALSTCDVRASRIALARARLDSLVDVRNPEIARQARLWAARAALAAGDRDAVPRYLAGIDASALQWELVQVSMAASEYARAESLLVERASRGEFRDDATRAVRDLWGAGEWDAAERIVAGYDVARAGDANRASMHYALGDLSLRAGRDSVARRHLNIARVLAGRDTVLGRESDARLALLGVNRMPTLADVDTLVAHQDSAVLRTVFARHVAEQLLLIRMLERNTDATGASLFLAAEVARDSVRANRLAVDLFLRVARDVSDPPLAPKAYYAASLLEPDSAADWRGRIQSQFPQSSIAVALSGGDPASRPDFMTTPDLLRFQWQKVIRAWSDSVRVLRTPPKVQITR